MAIHARVPLATAVLFLGSVGLAPAPTPPAEASGIVPGHVVAVFREVVPSLPFAEPAWRSDELRAALYVTSPREAASLLSTLEARRDVVHAFLEPVLPLSFIPNDPLYGSQWGPVAIKLPAAWENGLGSHTVRVAVLDTGVATNHVDLGDNASPGDPLCGPDQNFVSPTAPPADTVGHGTHVAGTVAARIHNAVGVAGMGNVCVMNVKVCAGLGCNLVSIIAGILYASAAGVDVISMSFGGAGFIPLLGETVKVAWARGVLLVAAAGNSGCGADTVVYPAAYPEVIAVAALSSATSRAGFSSCGPDVEIAAPGQGIVSTVPGGYASFSGTSMATPHVSGVAALVKSHNPALPHELLRCILQKTADELGPVGRDTQYGFGRLDAAQAVAAANDPVFLATCPLPALP